MNIFTTDHPCAGWKYSEIAWLSKNYGLDFTLSVACYQGWNVFAEKLLKRGVSVNGSIEETLGPLQAAIEGLRPDTIKLLLKYGADPNQGMYVSTLYKQGYPLDVAQNVELGFLCKETTQKICTILIENGARKCLFQYAFVKDSLNKIRIKERAKVYMCVSKVLPLDLAQMVAECF